MEAKSKNKNPAGSILSKWTWWVFMQKKGLFAKHVGSVRFELYQKKVHSTHQLRVHGKIFQHEYALKEQYCVIPIMEFGRRS